MACALLVAEGVAKVGPMVIAGLIGTILDAHGRTCVHCFIVGINAIDHGMSTHIDCSSCTLFLITVVTSLFMPRAPAAQTRFSFCSCNSLQPGSRHWVPPLGATAGCHCAALQVLVVIADVPAPVFGTAALF